MKSTDLREALLELAVTLLELAVMSPFPSAHWERVFSRMKRVLSPARSNMAQERKENLVLLEVNRKLLRWLAKQPLLKENVIARFI